MFVKQTVTLFYENIDIHTFNMLKKNNKYKLFKFRFQHLHNSKSDNNHRTVVRILDEMPKLEIEFIKIENDSHGLVNKLQSSSQFDTNQELFKVLEYKPKVNQDSQNLIASQAEAYHINQNHDKYAYIDQILINELNEDLKIDCEANKV